MTRRHKRAVRFAAAALLLLTWGGLKLAGKGWDQPPHAKQRSKVMYDRAVGICTTLGDVCSVDSRPSFTERHAVYYPGDGVPLRTWKYLCTVDGRQIAMVFDDDTGKLRYLAAERHQAALSVNNAVATIANRKEAAEVGFQRLKAMQLLPHGSLVALNGVPSQSRIHDVWEMTWNVKANPQAAPYTIRLTLDRNSHMPVSVVDAGNSSVH